VFAFAGPWEIWRGPDGAAVETFTILTTTANDRVRAFHDRMPVIVARSGFATWLEDARPPAEVERLFTRSRRRYA
jgi:putative SOS response-associated peptidase YedK